MKKILAIAIGMGIALGTISLSWGADDTTKSTSSKKMSKKKKKTESTTKVAQ